MEPDGLTGERLARARRDAHFLQRALADALGVSLRTVQNYEAGKFLPYRHLDALGRLLGCTTGWLLYGHGEPDADRLLARARQERSELRRNVARLVELRDQLANNTARTESGLSPMPPADEESQDGGTSRTERRPRR